MRALFLLLFLVGYLSPSWANGPDERPIILVLGDSLSAGFGMEARQGWVNLLRDRLSAQGFPYRVVNASISGDTTLGGLDRLPAALTTQRPSIVILELGGNDGLRGLPLQAMRDNLAKAIELSQQAGAKVLLVGMQIPPNYGPAYTRGFMQIYRQLAERYAISLVPFLLAGVSEVRHLMQADNIHPTAEAQPRLLDNVWPQLEPLLK
jgi:acyl-CoA thioesterase-1